ncbi:MULTISPECIES: energy transducer TonB [unclassified Rhizobium]|uniref:TonB family protein n=1 Tax=unclassified Rhizobium TaxID=2613769 RepID=UPI0006FCDEB3|nr:MULTISPECIES: energy transducer TonB [unclassified Rhizobium]KQV38173.1 energy transducer TonB [Rhizobium sp. Root1212]KRD30830.1 energy transducer TonB [Rhizobium sp. Root268]
MKTFLKWSVAIGFSLLAHAGTAALFQPEREEITEQIAGGEAMEVTLLGNAFEDAVQAGNPDEIVDPLETPPEEMEPIEEVAPVEAPVSTETSTDVQPVEADVVLPAEEVTPYTVATAEVTATVSPVEIVVPEEKPEIRPEPERIEKPKEKPPAEKKIERKKPVKKKAGEDGNAAASAKKGQADGVADAQASTASGKKGNTNQQAGNAAASNYAGKVRSKLNRAFRYPSSAKREGLTGTAQVRFTVSANGSVSGVGIARSAGFPILDQAALAAVQRAAPFPKIPEGAGRSSWVFTIPLVFE